MARRKVHVRWIRYGKARTIPARIRVQRIGSGPGFEACVHLARGTRIERIMRGHHNAGGCASGRNPRAAIARALHKFARGMSRRQGAFYGVR